MTNRIFTLRKDRLEASRSILQYIETKGRTSKSGLKSSNAVHRSYARISVTVDWLANVGFIKKQKKMIRQRGKAGKAEVFYTLKEPDWKRLLQPKQVNRKLQNLRKRIEVLEEGIEDRERRIEEFRQQEIDEESRWQSDQALYEQLIGK